MRCLVAFDDISDLEESDEGQLVQTIFAGGNYARLMGGPERMNKKKVVERNAILGQATKIKLSVMSL